MFINDHLFCGGQAEERVPTWRSWDSGEEVRRVTSASCYPLNCNSATEHMFFALVISPSVRMHLGVITVVSGHTAFLSLPLQDLLSSVHEEDHLAQCLSSVDAAHYALCFCPFRALEEPQHALLCEGRKPAFSEWWKCSRQLVAVGW